ncbi:hypothetical protein AB0I94_30795 [Streptomyces sp. NPDC050147]|uniref:hypothetical protein n=1 Tax=Streptomyces sp. NPDC050147 TaxID=3155513 RepID=UPI00342D0BA0
MSQPLVPALRTLAILAALPYLTLKVAWIAGSHLGIPAGSSLLEHRGTMIFANSLTLLMDASVIVLALLLTRPWGLRSPAWLLTLPMWAATGLLTPIMIGFPLQLLIKALGGSINEPSTQSGEGDGAFLDSWVFGVVYGGFIVQGLALGALFVRYARDRWGHVWRGRAGDPPRARATGHRGVQRGAALAAALLALAPMTMHLLWVTGSTVGLSEARAGERTTDFYALEALDMIYLGSAVAGGLLLAFRAFRWLPVLPVKVPLALAWVGSGAVACWGGWLLFASVGGTDDISRQPTAAMLLTYSVQMIAGMLVATVGVGFLRERAGAAGQVAADRHPA